MANRHAHKKLRAEIRAHIAKTGDGYQTARNRILAARERQHDAVELVATRYFGMRMTLATFQTPSPYAVMISWELRKVEGWGYPSVIRLNARGLQ